MHHRSPAHALGALARSLPPTFDRVNVHGELFKTRPARSGQGLPFVFALGADVGAVIGQLINAGLAVALEDGTFSKPEDP